MGLGEEMTKAYRPSFALGRILNAMVSGERAPDLSALPEGLARALRAMVEGM